MADTDSRWRADTDCQTRGAELRSCSGLRADASLPDTLPTRFLRGRWTRTACVAASEMDNHSSSIQGSGSKESVEAPSSGSAAQTASAYANAMGGRLIESVANGLSLIALEEWTMTGAIESGIDLLRDRLDPNMADLDQAIPQWVFQRAKARKQSPVCCKYPHPHYCNCAWRAALRCPHGGTQGVAFMWVYKARAAYAPALLWCTSQLQLLSVSRVCTRPLQTSRRFALGAAACRHCR